MAKLDAGETVVCSIEIKDSAGTLTSPATSMTISIIGPTETTIVATTAMTNDSTGKYHYDYNSASTAARGVYRVTYTATDGTRITIQEATFELS